MLLQKIFLRKSPLQEILKLHPPAEWKALVRREVQGSPIMTVTKRIGNNVATCDYSDGRRSKYSENSDINASICSSINSIVNDTEGEGCDVML